MTYTHAIIYVGAPYADDESGHIVSRHKSELAAARRFKRQFSGTTGEFAHMIVSLRPDGTYDLRQGFGLAGANIVIQEATT